MDILTEDFTNEILTEELTLSNTGELEQITPQDSPYLIGIFLLLFFFVCYTGLRNAFLRLFYVGGR